MTIPASTGLAGLTGAARGPGAWCAASATPVRYAFALGFTGVALAARLSLDAELGHHLPFSAFYVSVAATACVAGVGPTLASIVLGYALGTWFFVDPRYGFALPTRTHEVAAAGYFAVGGAIAALSSVTARARRRSERASVELARRQRQLEDEIRERRAAEQALRETQIQLSTRAVEVEAILDSIADAVLVYAADGELIRTNDAADRVFSAAGVARDTPSRERQAALGLLSEDGRPLAPAEYPAIRALAGETVTGAVVCVAHGRPMAEGRWYSVSAAPLRGVDGAPGGAVLSLADITERKRAEEAVRRSEQLLRAVGDRFAYGLWIAGPDGRNVMVSRPLLEMLGLTQEQFTRGAWLRRLEPGDARGLVESWAAAVRSGGDWTWEVRVRGADGERRTVLSSGKPVRGQDGAVSCWAGVNFDITERKRMEEALVEADRRKDEFLAMLSHELRNPLAPLRTALHVLDRPDAAREQMERARTIMGRQVEQLARLVDDLLDVTRISRGTIQVHRARVDVAEVVRRTVDDHRALFAARRIAVAVDAPAPLWVDGDAIRIAQVVGNLLHNAAKFTGDGGHVSVIAETEAAQASIRVADDGVGIPADLLDQVFEPFVQADRSLDRTRGGLGLGLSLVKSLVALHGGSTEARSEGPGRGAELVVRLPLAPVPAVGAAAVVPSRAGGRARVLVVEDNLDAAETLQMIIELEGHDVAVANDGQRGVAAAQALRPDLVFCDIGLPGIDGYEVARQIRRDAAIGRTYLVALTGYAQPEDRRRAAEAGFDEHLAKPVSLDQIQAVLARVASAPALVGA